MRPRIPENLKDYKHHGLNVGLGVQSTATALMCINGDLPKPDFFIFADTGWEREGTYENYDRLAPLAEQAGIPFHIVRNGNIREQQLDPEFARTELPYYTDPSRFVTVAGKRELFIKDIKKKFFFGERTRKKFEKGVNAMLDATPELKSRAYYANGVRLHGSMKPIGERPFEKGGQPDELDRDGVCGSAGCTFR